MNQFHWTMAYSLRWLIYITVLLTLLARCRSSLILSPSKDKVVRDVNESHIVTCIGGNGGGDSNEASVPLKWTRGMDKAIGNRGHPHVSTAMNGTALHLIFERISTADASEYYCRSGNEMLSFKLIVISPISFVNYPEVQTAQEHRSVLIKCKAKGDPQPKIVWKFQGRELPSDRYKTQKEGLHISNVTLEDRGNYTCKAYQVSQVTSSLLEKYIWLNVQHKPLHKKPVHAKVNQAYGYVGGIVNLTCEAIAEPAANFSWFRQHKKTMPGRIIEEPHWSILQLYIQNSSMFGDYLCKATNEFGTLDQIITLQEGVKPPTPRQLKLRARGSDTLELDIVEPDLNGTQLEPGMMPTGYQIQYRIKGDVRDWDEANVADFVEFEQDDPYSHILTDLIQDTVYEVRVATRNVAGLSDFTEVERYRTLRLQADSVTSQAICSSHRIKLQEFVFVLLLYFLTKN